MLDAVNVQIPTGSTASIVGPSGSGKTTLLGLCAGLDRATSGTVQLDGKDITNFSEGERAQLRRESIGFIFQNFQLMPNLTAIERRQELQRRKKEAFRKGNLLSQGL